VFVVVVVYVFPMKCFKNNNAKVYKLSGKHRKPEVLKCFIISFPES